MWLYVVLTACLLQRGSAESKDPDKREDVDKEPRPSKENAPGPVRKGGFVLRVYKHSLALAFLFLFLISFAGHALCGVHKYNSEALEHGDSVVSVWGYMQSATVWFESFQNWQSEFLAILAIVVLSIWLRQHGSPESKPVDAPHEQTGR